LVAAAKFLFAATKILFVPNFLVVPKPFFSVQRRQRQLQQEHQRHVQMILVNCFDMCPDRYVFIVHVHMKQSKSNPCFKLYLF